MSYCCINSSRTRKSQSLAILLVLHTRRLIVPWTSLFNVGISAAFGLRATARLAEICPLYLCSKLPEPDDANRRSARTTAGGNLVAKVKVIQRKHRNRRTTLFRWNQFLRWGYFCKFHDVTTWWTPCRGVSQQARPVIGLLWQP